MPALDTSKPGEMKLFKLSALKPSKTYHANVYWQRVSPLLLANYMFRPDFAVAKYFSTLHMANDSFTVKVDYYYYYFFFLDNTPNNAVLSKSLCTWNSCLWADFLCKVFSMLQPGALKEMGNGGNLVGIKDKLLRDELTLQTTWKNLDMSQVSQEMMLTSCPEKGLVFLSMLSYSR